MIRLSDLNIGIGESLEFGGVMVYSRGCPCDVRIERNSEHCFRVMADGSPIGDWPSIKLAIVSSCVQFGVMYNMEDFHACNHFPDDDDTPDCCVVPIECYSYDNGYDRGLAVRKNDAWTFCSWDCEHDGSSNSITDWVFDQCFDYFWYLDSTEETDTCNSSERYGINLSWPHIIERNGVSYDKRLNIDFLQKNYTTECSYRGVQGYHAHHNDTMNKAKKTAFGDLRVGVELEVEFNNNTSLSTFAQKRSNWFFCERDGSLNDYGCEIITVPLAREDAVSMEFWSKLTQNVKGAHSWNSERTGLHVHISRSYISDEVLGRLLYLNYYVLGDALKKRVFGRGTVHYARGYSNSRVETYSSDGQLLRLRGVQKLIKEGIKDGVGGDRYYSINTTNDNTIEFRQGKGSIHAGRISGVCEFCLMMCDYCRSHADLAKYTEDSFMEFVAKKGSIAVRSLTFGE